MRNASTSRGSRSVTPGLSVLATVDAYTGRIDLYLSDETDPIARAWSEIFPTLFRTKEELPAEVARSPEVPGRPLRDAGRGLRTVPRHAARPLRERVRRVVQAPQPLRLAGGCRRHQFRRVGRGRPPGDHEARVQVLASAGREEARALAGDVLHPTARAESRRVPERLGRRAWPPASRLSKRCRATR